VSDLSVLLIINSNKCRFTGIYQASSGLPRLSDFRSCQLIIVDAYVLLLQTYNHFKVAYLLDYSSFFCLYSALYVHSSNVFAAFAVPELPFWLFFDYFVFVKLGVFVH
jgi:hypothetical protein